MAYQQVLVCFCLISIVYSQLDSDSGERILTGSSSGNITYVELISRKIYFPNVTLLIELEDISLNHHEGDLLLIGPGKKEDVFMGAPGWMFVESQIDSYTFRINGQNATVVFVPGGKDNEKKAKIKWKRIGIETNDPPTTQIPTTPVSEADRMAVIVCFKGAMTCAKFEEPNIVKPFKIGLAEEANRYAAKANIQLTKVISTDIKVTCKDSCIINAQNSNNKTSDCGKAFLIVTITDRWNSDLPVFKTEQLRKIISAFDSDKSQGIMECRTYPDFSWWLWGSAVMLVIVIVITILCCKYSDHEFKCMEGIEKTKPSKKVPNGNVNHAFEYEDFYEITDNHVGTSPPETPAHKFPELGSTSFPTDNFILRSETNPLGTPNMNSRRLQTSRATENPAPKFGENPGGTPKMNSSRKFVTPTIREDLIMKTDSSEPPHPQWTRPKEPDVDAVSRTSTHLYEDPDYLRLKLRNPSPTLSLRKLEDDEDTEL